MRVIGKTTTRSLPHRQLRKSQEEIALEQQSSLPHRQLRKLPAIILRAGDSSLPHRQLRNDTDEKADAEIAFTAAQAA